MANIKITFQFKRDTAENWTKNNPVLSEGEPGFVVGSNRLKIGDGVTPWKDLPFMGESSVVNAKTHYDFPSIGRDNVLYKAEEEKKIYQWNSAELKYEEMCEAGESGDMSSIELINGGGAVLA